LALTQFLSVLKLLKSIDNKVAEIAAYTGLANVYVKMEAFKEANKYLEKAQGLAIAAGDDQELCELYMAQAIAYIAEKRIDLAVGKYKLGMDLTKKRKLPYTHAVFEDLHRNLNI
jgi:tetratricopeptide (TPR) repeat protein